MKITRDASDVAGLMQAQGSRSAPRVFTAVKLASWTRWAAPKRFPDVIHANPYAPAPPRRPAQVAAYGMVVERLRPLPPKFRRWVNRMGQTLARNRRVLFQDLARECPKKKDRFACLRGAKRLMDMQDDLVDYGIELKDVHYGNIGIGEDGRWKALDLGQAAGTGAPDVDDLEGARRLRRRRR